MIISLVCLLISYYFPYFLAIFSSLKQKARLKTRYMKETDLEFTLKWTFPWTFLSLNIWSYILLFVIVIFLRWNTLHINYKIFWAKRSIAARRCACLLIFEIIFFFQALALKNYFRHLYKSKSSRNIAKMENAY